MAGTFITGINLYDRVIEQRRQKKLDRGQNKKIKDLEQRLNEAEDEKKRMKEAGNGGNNGNNNNNNNLKNSLQQSGNQVQQEYDRYFANLGPRFAQGDCTYPLPAGRTCPLTPVHRQGTKLTTHC